MKKRRPSRLESSAFHEGGHALVGHLLDRDIDNITIIATGDIRGYTLSHRRQAFPGIINHDDGPLANRLTYLYAGIVAQRLFCTKRGVSPKSVRLGEDGRAARNSVRNLSKEEQIELLNSAEKDAVKLLSDPQNWPILERIAAKLLEFGTLDGPSLLELFPETQYTLS